jgi:all-trans-retinol 13,14-reductase
MMLYGGVKDKTPIYIHSLMTNFYMQSPYRIKDGSHSIANSLVKSIKKFGGEVYTNSEVVDFVCDDTKMTKVRLKNGQEFEAEHFISNLHPQTSLEKIKSNLLRHVYRDRINNIENTPASFTVFIKFKNNSAKYLNYNFHYYDNEEIWNLSEKNITDFPSSYYYLHQAGEDEVFAESAEIVAFMDFDEVKKWENTTIGHRGEDYEKFKQKQALKILDKVERSFPGFKDTIEDFWVATPLTYRDYTATPNGSMYGIVRDKNFPIQTRISQRTKIPNFFFTGQNINSHGILGVIVGSIITSAEILGMEQIINDITNSN